jgi:hypothetical protein
MWLEAFSLSRFLSQILHETIKYDTELGVVKCLLKFEHKTNTVCDIRIWVRKRDPFLALNRIIVMGFSMTVIKSRQERRFNGMQCWLSIVEAR